MRISRISGAQGMVAVAAAVMPLLNACTRNHHTGTFADLAPIVLNVMPQGLDPATEQRPVAARWPEPDHRRADGCRQNLARLRAGPQGLPAGYSVRYLRLPRLMEELGLAHGDGRFAKLMACYAKTDLLILDDWGLGTVYRCATPRNARTAGRQLRQPLDAGYQPNAGGKADFPNSR